ncbi:hypothetical protein Tco_0854644 [Tanacetum coccineum]
MFTEHSVHLQPYMAWFKALKSHLRILYDFRFLCNRTEVGFQHAFRIYFGEEHMTFVMKMLLNLDQLQLKLDRENLHECDPKTCLEVLRTQFKELYDSNGGEFWIIIISVCKRTSKTTLAENLKLTDMKEKEVKAIKEIENPLNERKMQTQDGMINMDMKILTQEGLVNEGIALDASLVSKESIDDNPTLTEQQDESNSLGYDVDAEKERVDKAVLDVENVVVGSSFDRDTLTEVHHSNNDTLEYVLAHGIQNHEQPESISDTYVVSEEEHDDVDNEQERVIFASLVNNLKCEVEKCTKVDREAQTDCSDSSHVASKEDSVNTRKQGLGFENQTDVENPYVLNKAKELNQVSKVYLRGYVHSWDPRKTAIGEAGKELSKYFEPLDKDEFDEKCQKRNDKTMCLDEKDFAILEAHCMSLELKSQNKSLTAVQNGHVLKQTSDEAQIKFDTEDLETINIELEHDVA